LLTLRIRGDAETELVMRFQQVTGPVMAKAIEDTAFYCFNRMVCLNEVGSDPTHFGIEPAEFFRACAETARHWPRTMTAISTHDTKRSGDVRARLALLSEIPVQWSGAVRRWAALNERHRTGPLPDRSMEYLFYQTAVGAWPLDPQRATAFMEKAAREAKVHTSWTNPNRTYEEALQRFVLEALGDEKFTRDAGSFAGELVLPGRINSLALALLQLTAPGVPDLYQGTELWDLSLVDPDNRRAVDYPLRRRLLAELGNATASEIWSRVDEGLPKMWLIRQALALRRRRPQLFGPESSLVALEVHGERARHAVAFARSAAAITIVPRLVMGLGGDWRDTAVTLPAGSWIDQLTGARFDAGRIALSELLREFPVALLALEDGLQ
jgi:(1->4)-alpha-D-glucan 1-alpha-D-glucosylmutase